MSHTYSDLLRWIEEWESPALEFKSSASEESLGKTIAAFANTFGGFIIIGVDPKTKIPIGVSNPDISSQTIRATLEQCRPDPRPEQEFIRHEGKTFIVLKIEAFPLSHNPCFFKKICYIRQGTTNLSLAGEELMDFLKKRALMNFEESRSKATIENLDLEKVEKLLKIRRVKIDSKREDELKSVLAGISVANYNGEFYLKNAALLFFAKEPNRFFSNLEVRIVKYRGIEPDLGGIILDKKVYGTIPDLIEQTYRLVKENIGKRLTLVGPKREELLDYPEQSLREVITNAIGHRDYFVTKEILIEIYEDRLQITNPGGLMPGQNINNFDRTPVHRNPITYRLLHEFKLGEGLGLGVRLIRTQFRQARLPDPDFFEIGNQFQVIFYNQSSKKPRKEVDFINPRQKQALQYLSKNQAMKTADYMKITGVSQATANLDLRELEKQGKIKKIGKYRGTHYTLSTSHS